MIKIDDARTEFVQTLQTVLGTIPALVEARIPLELEKDPDQYEIRDKEEITIEEESIVCPHGKQTIVHALLGVIAYEHNDNSGQYCDLMNKFKTSVDEVLSTIISDRELKNTIAVQATLAASSEARIKLYDKLSLATANELSDLLEMTVLIYAHTRKNNELLQELVSAFGQPVIKNIKLLFQKDLSHMYLTKSSFRPMKDLQAIHIKGIAELKQEIKQKKKNQTLDDILYG